jgi:iron complex outermembrane receptor protein
MNSQKLEDRGIAAMLFGIAVFGFSPTAIAQSVSLGTTQSQRTPLPPDQQSSALETIIVTARLRQEDAQAVPISLSVVNSATLEKTYTNNVSQLTSLVPSLNYVSPNPRNTAFTIRGLGSSVVAVSQSNDGLEPGIGFYVDQVYHGRPATAAFDFVDLDRVEVLRGPQGTLFGKNTTAGAINIVSKIPTFDRELNAEVSGGNLGYYEAKASLSGGLIDNLMAGRISAITTGRDGVIRNVTTGRELNDVNNSAFRAQLLVTPSDAVKIRFTSDYSSVYTDCCTQVYFTVGTSLKPLARQYAALAAGLNYRPPSLNPYDRLTDIDAALKVATNEGGLSAIADWNLGAVTLTSVSAWRFWNWDAANDRDYTRLSIQTVQHIPSRQDQYSQELRVASNGTQRIDYVAGLYWFAQTITGEPITEYGPLAAYWLLGKPPAIPGNLLDGYLTDGHTRFHSDSYAAFGEATWHATDRLNVTAGIRYTDEQKDGRFDSTVSGGLATPTPAQLNSKLSILRPQSYTARVSDGSPAGRLNLAYSWSETVMTYASLARGSKSGGINMSGLPLNAANQPALTTAVIKPEQNTTAEVGMKTRLLDHRLVLNADVYETTVRDFQTNVVDSGPGALRGYLANIAKVRVEGAELDAAFAMTENLTGHLSAAYSDGKYISYKNGPCPLELISSSTTVCDLSGKALSALPRWVESLGGEYAHPRSNDPADQARMTAQARLIEAYERARWPRRAPSLPDLLTYLMDQHDLSRADLVPLLGTPSRVSEVLTGKRQLSMSMVRNLRERFHISADLLIAPMRRSGLAA